MSAPTEPSTWVCQSPGTNPCRDILVVDDDAANLIAIEAALGDLGHRLVKARSGREALRRLLEQDFALILLDVRMPDLDGFETARLIRERARNRGVPIVFVTAHSHEDSEILRGYELGAVDFLFKPIVPQVLRAKALVFVELQERTAELRLQAEQLRAAERREHEQRLSEHRQRWEAEILREENRRKDEFLAILGHELRNPLSPLVTGLEILRLSGLEREDQRRVRDAMERQVHHLVRLVDDLLDVARISQGKIELSLRRFAIADAVRQAIESVSAALAERHQELVVDDPGEVLWVDGDRIRLTQVMVNLLTNAVRYSEPGGEIRVSWRRDGEQVVLAVADQGQGIEPQMLEAIFDLFVQGRKAADGLGLGLTLVRRLVQKHGGVVVARSAGAGLGAEFEVRLPLAPAGERTDEDPPAALATGGSLAVVVVDDDPDIRESMGLLLENWGHRVETAANGELGLEILARGGCDLALIDLGMPGIDGFEVARRARGALGDETPYLVAISGFGRPQDKTRAREAGFDSHLTKPAQPEQLRQLLRKITDDDSGVCERKEAEKDQGHPRPSKAGRKRARRR